MNTIDFIIFTVLTASVALLDYAETSADPALHKAEISDDVEDQDSEPAEKSSFVAHANGLAYSNANRILPQLQAQVPPSTRPAPILVNVVECHVCVDCPNVYENMTTKLCPHTFDVTRQNRCVTYAERYKHMKRSWYIRGCSSERGSCDDIRKAHTAHSDIVQLISCHECEGDKCNSSSGFRALSDLTFAVFAVIVAPIVGKYTLS